MRIRLVTQWYPPEPAGVPAGIARGLASRGHALDVLTGFPNYPTGKLHEHYPLQWYRRDVDRSDAGDVVVHRAPLYPSHDARALPRVANYASFALASTALALTALPAPDVWLTYSSPATAGLPALGAGVLDRARERLRSKARPAHAQIIQDLWPDSVTDAGFVDGPAAQAMARALDAFCRYGYRHSDAIGVISAGMRRVLVERGVPDERIVDTPNWVDAPALPRLDPAQAAARRTELGLPADGPLFVYAGNLGELQALPGLVDAFAAVPHARLALIGPGVMADRLRRQIAERGIDGVALLPAQPPERIGDFLACADVLVVSLADTPLLRVTMPSKVAGSLAAGRPVLAHAAGDAADVVVGSGAGLAAPPGDPARLADVVRRMAAWDADELARRGHAARGWYEAHIGADACIDGHERLVRLAAQNAGTRVHDTRPPPPPARTTP